MYTTWHVAQRSCLMASSGAYLMASGLFPGSARMQGCPALAQFKHDGISSSHLIFCDRHRAQAVPFRRPTPGCGLCPVARAGAAAASAVVPSSALSIEGVLRAAGGQGEGGKKPVYCPSASDWEVVACERCVAHACSARSQVVARGKHWLTARHLGFLPSRTGTLPAAWLFGYATTAW
jgi:hypothetical protein